MRRAARCLMSSGSSAACVANRSTEDCRLAGMVPIWVEGSVWLSSCTQPREE
jgi:hypothetical protein